MLKEKQCMDKIKYLLRFRRAERQYDYSSTIGRIIIISIQPEGRLWQEPEPSQATGMALVHCILGSFLGVGCHCFPPPLPPRASDMRDLYQRKTELWARNGRSILPVIPTST